MPSLLSSDCILRRKRFSSILLTEVSNYSSQCAEDVRWILSEVKNKIKMCVTASRLPDLMISQRTCSWL